MQEFITIDQGKWAKHFPKLNYRHLVIGRFLNQWFGSGIPDQIVCEDIVFFWTQKSVIISMLPVLKFKNEDSVYRLFKDMAEAGIIELCPDNRKLNKTYLRPGPMMRHLIFSDTVSRTLSIPFLELSEGYGKKTVPPKLGYRKKTVPSDEKQPLEQMGEGTEKRPDDILYTILYTILDILNKEVLCRDKSKRGFSPTAKNLAPIRKLVAAKYTSADCKLVVAYWAEKWWDAEWPDNRRPGKMVKGRTFLRPSTIYGPKFDEYLSEAVDQKSSDPKVKEQAFTRETM